MRIRYALPIVLASTVLIAAVALVAYSVTQRASSDDVKYRIVAEFKADPMRFPIDAASRSLAESRLEGEFAVCTEAAEATGAQYIELSGLVDKFGKDIPGLQLALNQALRDANGVSDCDYRVLMELVNDHKRQLMTGGTNPPVKPVTSGAS